MSISGYFGWNSPEFPATDKELLKLKNKKSTERSTYKVHWERSLYVNLFPIIGSFFAGLYHLAMVLFEGDLNKNVLIGRAVVELMGLGTFVAIVDGVVTLNRYLNAFASTEAEI